MNKFFERNETTNKAEANKEDMFDMHLKHFEEFERSLFRSNDRYSIPDYAELNCFPMDVSKLHEVEKQATELTEKHGLKVEHTLTPEGELWNTYPENILDELLFGDAPGADEKTFHEDDPFSRGARKIMMIAALEKTISKQEKDRENAASEELWKYLDDEIAEGLNTLFDLKISLADEMVHGIINSALRDDTDDEIDWQ